MKKLLFIIISLFFTINFLSAQDTIKINTNDGPLLMQIYVYKAIEANPYISWEETSKGIQVLIQDISGIYKDGILITNLNTYQTITTNRYDINGSSIRITDIEGNDIIQPGIIMNIKPLIYILKFAPTYRYNKNLNQYLPDSKIQPNVVLINNQIW